jgi:hypothetical protein
VRSMPALIVYLRPAWKRPDWKVLQNDAAELRRSSQLEQPALPGPAQTLDRSPEGLR